MVAYFLAGFKKYRHLWTFDSVDLCGVRLKIGQTYLIGAFYNPETDHLELNACTSLVRSITEWRFRKWRIYGQMRKCLQYEKNIPITVCLALVIGYICGGACFFSSSEDWSFLDASYFCFITLSTIGFGDLVPGRTVFSTPEDGQMTLAICALYLLFGMALLAMSLNLVKEKVLETVRIIGQRIGILVKDEDEDDDSNG
uniref:Potassium channel subfamily K member 9 n=1 Tax=Sarcoptes scabiei TaxID=52283 RepID=A0A834VHE5_SARSC